MIHLGLFEEDGMISEWKKPEGFEIQIVQNGTTYHVSGKSAAELHSKLLMLPVEARDFDVGPLKDGRFSMRKITPPYMMGVAS
jgi:hypothetical protein